jgi:hypothetical protein
MPECITNVIKVIKVLISIKIIRPSFTVNASERLHESALCKGCKHGHYKEIT